MAIPRASHGGDPHVRYCIRAYAERVLGVLGLDNAVGLFGNGLERESPGRADPFEAWLTAMEPVELAEPLDVTSALPAEPQQMPDANRPGGPECWNSRFGSGVLTDEQGVE